MGEPEPCQIEGLNGRLMTGTLLTMDPAEGVAKVRIPPARIAIPLRFNQFRTPDADAPAGAAGRWRRGRSLHGAAPGGGREGAPEGRGRRSNA